MASISASMSLTIDWSPPFCIICCTIDCRIPSRIEPFDCREPAFELRRRGSRIRAGDALATAGSIAGAAAAAGTVRHASTPEALLPRRPEPTDTRRKIRSPLQQILTNSLSTRAPYWIKGLNFASPQTTHLGGRSGYARCSVNAVWPYPETIR